MRQMRAHLAGSLAAVSGMREQSILEFLAGASCREAISVTICLVSEIARRNAVASAC
jgi:hypothetical protein